MAGEQPKTIRNDQIRVSNERRSGMDVLKASKPYFEAAVQALTGKGQAAQQSISVPPQVLHDLIALVIAEQKRADALLRGKRPDGTDKGDGDWNPFNGIDFEFD
jgi:hypothetical protein